ncbi:MAG: hypothetical protein RLP44_17710 [Aggregatilineales bacterium]
MAIGDAILMTGCLAGFMVALPALLIFLNLMFTRTTFSAAQRLHTGFKMPLVIGIIAMVVIGFPASLLVSAGSIFQLFGTILWLFLLAWLFTGLATVARMLGGRLGMLSNREQSMMTEAVVGTFVLSFAIAFPLIGWFVILPLSMAIGVGATLIARRESVYDTPEPQDDTHMAGAS